MALPPYEHPIEPGSGGGACAGDAADDPIVVDQLVQHVPRDRSLRAVCYAHVALLSRGMRKRQVAAARGEPGTEFLRRADRRRGLQDHQIAGAQQRRQALSGSPDEAHVRRVIRSMRRRHRDDERPGGGADRPGDRLHHRGDRAAGRVRAAARRHGRGPGEPGRRPHALREPQAHDGPPARHERGVHLDGGDLRGRDAGDAARQRRGARAVQLRFRLRDRRRGRRLRQAGRRRGADHPADRPALELGGAPHRSARADPDTAGPAVLSRHDRLRRPVRRRRADPVQRAPRTATSSAPASASSSTRPRSGTATACTATCPCSRATRS